MGKIKVNLIGEDGNIFNLVGIVSREMRRNGLEELASEMRNRVFNSESYDNALQIIMEYVDIV